MPELTVVENVALPAMLNGRSRHSAEDSAQGWLDSLGLKGLGDRRIGQLSGGQAQRVAIARAQAVGAGIIFADEPTGSLDSHTSMDVMDALISSTTENAKTLVVVTHSEEIAGRCKRIVHLSDGRIISDKGVVE